MSTGQSPAERIVEEVSGWPPVEVRPGGFGSLAFVVGRREIGHLHGDHAAHFAFPRKVRAELLEQGRVEQHPVDSPGLAARRITSEADVREVVELLRLNYDRLMRRTKTAA